MALAPAYFPTQLPGQYRQRWGVSLPCSEWERVGPPRSRHQGHPSQSQVPSSKLRFSAGLELETWKLELGTKSLALSLILKAGGRARGRAASHSAIGAARLHPLPDFDVRSINQLVLLGPYDLEGRGSSSWSVLRA